VFADDQFAFAADNGCSVPDPAALLDADGAAAGDALVFDWDIDVFEGVVVIHDQNLRSEDNIALEMDAVYPGDHTTPSQLDALIENNDWFVGFRNFRDIDPNFALEQNRVSELDVRGNGPRQIAGIVHIEIAAKEGERIEPLHAQSTDLVGDPGDPGERIFGIMVLGLAH